MSAAEYAGVATSLICLGLGIFAGHAAGYYRATHVRRRRVGAPE